MGVGVGVGEVVCKGAASWGEAGDSIGGTAVGWDAPDDSICGSARSWFMAVDSICGGESVGTVVGGGAEDCITD